MDDGRTGDGCVDRSHPHDAGSLTVSLSAPGPHPLVASFGRPRLDRPLGCVPLGASMPTTSTVLALTPRVGHHTSVAIQSCTERTRRGTQ